jgi:hypothetical protein
MVMGTTLFSGLFSLKGRLGMVGGLMIGPVGCLRVLGISYSPGPGPVNFLSPNLLNFETKPVVKPS